MLRPCPECKWCVSRCGLACRLGHAQTRNYKGTGQAVRHTKYSGPSCPGPLLPSYCSSRLEELWLHVGFILNNNINKPILYIYIHFCTNIGRSSPIQSNTLDVYKALSMNSLPLLGHSLVLVGPDMYPTRKRVLRPYFPLPVECSKCSVSHRHLLIAPIESQARANGLTIVVQTI